MSTSEKGYAEVVPYNGLWSKWQVRCFAPSARSSSAPSRFATFYRRSLEKAMKVAEDFCSKPFIRVDLEQTEDEG